MKQSVMPVWSGQSGCLVVSARASATAVSLRDAVSVLISLCNTDAFREGRGSCGC